MKYVNANGKQMSIFTLGTVQLGMDYGLGEHRKKPSEEKASAKGRAFVRQRSDIGYVSLAILMRDLFGNMSFIHKNGRRIGCC